MLSLGVFGAIAVHVNCAFLVLTAKLVTRGVLFERYLIVWQTRMLAHDMMYSGSTTETRLDENRVANRVASPIGLFIKTTRRRSGSANFNWGKLPHTGGKSLHSSLPCYEKMMIRGGLGDNLVPRSELNKNQSTSCGSAMPRDGHCRSNLARSPF
jgi:hypothetical protein